MNRIAVGIEYDGSRWSGWQSQAGIPTVLYGAGPRTLEEANGHRADENLKLEDLYRATEVVARTFVDLLEEKA